MFDIKVSLPNIYKIPVDEVSKKYSKKNNKEMSIEFLVESVIRRYISDEFRVILLDSEEKKEGQNGGSD